MFVSQEVFDVVTPPWSQDLRGIRAAGLRAALDAFTEGRRISVANDPFKKPKTTYMARIDPLEDGVFDIRYRDPKPGIRVFGNFALTDVFVALTWRHREDLETEKNWRDEINRCKAKWRDLFFPYLPYQGVTLNDYVSRNFDPV